MIVSFFRPYPILKFQRYIPLLIFYTLEWFKPKYGSLSFSIKNSLEKAPKYIFSQPIPYISTSKIYFLRFLSAGDIKQVDNVYPGALSSKLPRDTFVKHLFE